jgi:hypothetical protein
MLVMQGEVKNFKLENLMGFFSDITKNLENLKKSGWQRKTFEKYPQKIPKIENIRKIE